MRWCQFWGADSRHEASKRLTMCVPQSLANLKPLTSLQEELKVVQPFHLRLSAACSRNAHIAWSFTMAAMKDKIITENTGCLDRCLDGGNWAGSKPLGHVNSRRVYATKLGRDGESDTEVDTLEETETDSSKKLLTLPTILTLCRIAAIPALLAVFYNAFLWSTGAGAGIFVLAAITDWLDGYLARKMKTSSAFGAFLDPVADKLMVATALVLLCTRPLSTSWATSFPWLIPIPSIAIIGREITMSAVREWAASQGGDVHKAVAVNSIGKWKTASQMVALTLLLSANNGRFDGGSWVSVSGVGLLYVAAGLACWSLAVYMKAIWASFLK